jgi:large subunit ribosomal protein L6
MSRIGKKAIEIPSGVKVEQSGQTVKISGPKGAMQMKCRPEIQVNVANNRIEVTNPDPANRQNRALHGTTRALLHNMVTGVSAGFQKEMLIYGTGYNVKEQGGKLILTVGYAQPAELRIPKEVKVEIKTAATKGNEVPAVFMLSSPDKHSLGQFAAEIRKVKPPEPYQGKGIRYGDEHVIRKEGKAFASGG